MLYIDPDWDSKKALNLRNHFEPILINNEKLLCDKCGKRHFPDEETFIVFYGNVTVGFTGGVLGNNFSEDGRLKRVYIFCRKTECLDSIISLLEKPSTTKKTKFEELLDH